MWKLASGCFEPRSGVIRDSVDDQCYMLNGHLFSMFLDSVYLFPKKLHDPNVGGHEQASFDTFPRVGVYNTGVQQEPSFVKMCLIYSSRRPGRTNRTT